MRIFITGNRGQLGSALISRLHSHDLAMGDLPEWDMTDPEAVSGAIGSFRPHIVIHAAALTRVDYCAEHPEEAMRVNGLGTYNIALACAAIDARLVAISTNEVFDGTASRPYWEYDTPNAINAYGASKLAAERVVERFAPRGQIVRTAWLYGHNGVNFIHRILARAEEGGPLRVVTDEVSSPTYVNDLADAIVALIDVERPGTYHFINSGACSRYEFAREILRLAGYDLPIEPITSDSFTRASTPPPYAPLANVFGAAAGITLRPWQEALAAFFSEYRSEASE